MKAQEIRIGNYLELLGEIRKVEGIFNLPKRKEMYWIKCENIIDTKIIHYKPIPLTEEWLVKFGLEYKSPFGYRIKMGSYIKDDLETNGYFFRWNGQTIKLMHYVHELQNIYFALTGEELTLNELL